MIPLSDFLAQLDQARGRVRPEMEETTMKLMELCAEKSKAIIGHEHDDWPPLAASTVAEKQRLGYVGHISPTDPLLRTGELRDSIKPAIESTFGEVTGIVSSELPYAADQELGTSRIPPRPFIAPPFLNVLPAAAAEEFGKVAVDLLLGKTR